MSGKLRQALEQVASRFRRVRLWGGLAACWLLLALAGYAISTLARGAGLGSIPSVWLLAGMAVLALTSGIACYLLATRSARDPRWVARRIEAKHPELGTELLAAVEEVEGRLPVDWASCRRLSSVKPWNTDGPTTGMKRSRPG